jgi:hypothetical protein
VLKRLFSQYTPIRFQRLHVSLSIALPSVFAICSPPHANRMPLLSYCRVQTTSPFPSFTATSTAASRTIRKTLWKSDTTRIISFGFQSAFTYRHRPQLGYPRRRPYYRAAIPLDPPTALCCKLYYYYGRLQLASLKFLGLVIASTITFVFNLRLHALRRTLDNSLPCKKASCRSLMFLYQYR